LNEACVLFLVGCKIPFNIIRRAEFREFISLLNPSYKIISKHIMHEILGKMAAELDSSLAKELRKAVALSFTMDGWSAFNKHFLAITVHFISADGRLNDGLLPLQFVNEAHSAANYLKKFNDAIGAFLRIEPTEELQTLSGVTGKEVDMNAYAIGGVTTDSAANMTKFGKESGLIHVPCVAHALNLCVRDVIDETENLIVVKRLRELVVTFRRSDRFNRALHEAQGLLSKKI
jgi:hypothetical protein